MVGPGVDTMKRRNRVGMLGVALWVTVAKAAAQSGCSSGGGAPPPPPVITPPAPVVVPTPQPVPTPTPTPPPVVTPPTPVMSVPVTVPTVVPTPGALPTDSTRMPADFRGSGMQGWNGPIPLGASRAPTDLGIGNVEELTGNEPGTSTKALLDGLHNEFESISKQNSNLRDEQKTLEKEITDLKAKFEKIAEQVAQEIEQQVSAEMAKLDAKGKEIYDEHQARWEARQDALYAEYLAVFNANRDKPAVQDAAYSRYLAKLDAEQDLRQARYEAAMKPIFDQQDAVLEKKPEMIRQAVAAVNADLVKELSAKEQRVGEIKAKLETNTERWKEMDGQWAKTYAQWKQERPTTCGGSGAASSGGGGGTSQSGGGIISETGTGTSATGSSPDAGNRPTDTAGGGANEFTQTAYIEKLLGDSNNSGIFGKLDRDGDGILNQNEINAGVKDKAYTGDDAAILAVLKLYEKDVTREQIQDPETLKLLYENAKRFYDQRDKRVATELFPNGVNPDDIVQGAVGDCYFLSAISSVANTQNGKNIISDMIQESTNANGDRTYKVTFHDPNEPSKLITMEVAPPTEGEMQVYAKGKNGMWVSVLEKAFGEYGRTHVAEGLIFKSGAPEETTARTNAGVPSNETATGVMQSNYVFRMLTGGEPGKLEFARDAKSVFGNEDTDKVAADVHNALTDLVNNGTPITAGIYDDSKLPEVAKAIQDRTPMGGTSSELQSNHEYSVVGYNPGTKTVTLRNPYGDTSKKNGSYIEMDLKTFTNTFSDIKWANMPPGSGTAQPRTESGLPPVSGTNH